ncbi:hypothetical protein L7F22_046621 [Adiantum nelumboides]|nr:hypothetical protein [Adiantum nelumboides]
MGVLTDGRALRKSHASRAAREDHELPTSLEDLFSEWKVLVGHNDWQNHHKRQEGATKYRVHNLPPDAFHSGVYELALYLDKSINAHGTRKATSSSLGKDAFVPVYVGQAENVRERLQHYGRSGSHLEGSLQEGKCLQCGTSYITEGQKNLGPTEKIVVCSNQELCSSPHLFTRAFFQGYSIAFRWKRA